MLTLCLVLVFGGIAGLLTTVVLHRREYAAIKRDYKRTEDFIEAVESFFSDKDDQGFTNFDKSIHILAEQMGKAQGMATVASLRGQTGAALKTAEGELIEAAYEADPVKAAVMQALPKKIEKNPILKMGFEHILTKAITAIDPTAKHNGDNPQGNTELYQGRKHRD